MGLFSGYGGYEVAGAAQGLSDGLDYLDKKREEARRVRLEDEQNTRANRSAELAEKSSQRADKQLTMNTETHAQAMDAAKLKAEADQHERDYHDAAGRFVSSNGTDTAALDDFHNKRFPNSPPTKLTLEPDGSYTLKYGDKEQKKLTKEHVIGLFSYTQNPDAYLTSVQKGAEEDRKFGHEKELKQMEASSRIAAAAARGGAERGKPVYQFDDEGNPYVFEGGTARRVKIEDAPAGPAAGITAPSAPPLSEEDSDTYSQTPPNQGGAPSADGYTMPPLFQKPAPIAPPARAAQGLTLPSATAETPTTPKFHKSNTKGGDSKTLQEVAAFAEHMPTIPGETKDQRWMRAAKERATLVGKNDPTAAVREYERTITAKIMSPEVAQGKPADIAKAQALISSMVEDFAARYGAAGTGAPVTPGGSRNGDFLGILPK